MQTWEDKFTHFQHLHIRYIKNICAWFNFSKTTSKFRRLSCCHFGQHCCEKSFLYSDQQNISQNGDPRQQVGNSYVDDLAIGCVRSLCPPVSQAQQLGSNKIFRQDVYVVYVLGEFVGVYFDCWINNKREILNDYMTIWSIWIHECIQLPTQQNNIIWYPWSMIRVELLRCRDTLMCSMPWKSCSF